MDLQERDPEGITDPAFLSTRGRQRARSRRSGGAAAASPPPPTKRGIYGCHVSRSLAGGQLTDPGRL